MYYWTGEDYWDYHKYMAFQGEKCIFSIRFDGAINEHDTSLYLFKTVDGWIPVDKTIEEVKSEVI
jgi:hypothetical protein